MVETTKAALDNPRVNTLFSAVAAVGVVVGIIVALVAWLTAGPMNSHDIAQLREQTQISNSALRDQIATLSAQVANLATKIDQGPRLDQLQVIDRHLSALDGRMDGMDRQAQSDRDRLTRTETLVQGIDAASRAPLGHR